MGDAKELIKLVQEGAECSKGMQDIRSLGEQKRDYFRMSHIPVKNRKTHLTIEPIELTDRESGDKSYEVHVGIGESSNPTVIPASDESDCRRIVIKIGRGEYDVEVDRGVVKLKLKYFD